LRVIDDGVTPWDGAGGKLWAGFGLRNRNKNAGFSEDFMTGRK